jgi:hypothetical protein
VEVVSMLGFSSVLVSGVCISILGFCVGRA